MLEHNYDVIYAISNSMQLMEHCMAIYEWLGGRFITNPDHPSCNQWLSKFGYPVTAKSPDSLGSLVDKDSIKIIVPSGSHGFSGLAGFNTFFTSHGVSEKASYIAGGVGGMGKLTPLQFSRYLRGTYEYSKEYHEKFLELDRSKPTILYAPTQGKFSSFSSKTIGIFTALKKSGKYNIVVKPHAICWKINEKEMKVVEREFPVDIFLHNITPFLDVADIIIGDISAATSAAFFYYMKPVILLKTIDTVLEGPIMDESMCYVVRPNDYENLPQIIDASMKVSKSMEDARRNYFKTWYGVIDGNEGLRYSEMVINHRSRE